MKHRIVKNLNPLTKIFWMGFFILVFLIPVYIWSVKVNIFNLFGELPSLESLENPDPDLASLIISADGKTIGRYYQFNRNPVDYEQLSPYLVQALVATEDRRFYGHSGIDLFGLIRAFVNTVILMKDPEGGSTITQQLAKMLWQTRSEENEGILTSLPVLRLPVIKTKEWIIATQIERSYTKKEIISMYFNTMPFGNNAFGIKVAAEKYFQTDPENLELQQAALLVGILNGPSFFNPVTHPQRAIVRRNWVLKKQYVNGYITKKEYQKAIESGLDLKFDAAQGHNRYMGYVKNVLRTQLDSWAMENGFDLNKDGLRIYTTIDSRLQAFAEQAVRQHMAYLQDVFEQEWTNEFPWYEDEKYIQNVWESTAKYRYLVRKFGSSSDSVGYYARLPRPTRVFSWKGDTVVSLSPLDSIKYFKNFLHTGFMAMDPHNGAIKAWVGGIDFDYFQYDHVKQGKNQPGSTFKPFVYTSAIEYGYSPCYEIMDAPVTYEIPGSDPPYWTPRNSNTQYNGEIMTLKEALRRSMNRVTAMLMHKLGAENVVNIARKMGISSPLNPVMSLSLGASDVNVHEMVGAYATYVNQGNWIEPHVVSHIEDNFGNLLMRFVPEKNEAISTETAWTMLQMLKGTIYEPDGTAYGIDPELKQMVEMAGKTGTTSDYADGWFIGVTPELVAGAWVGGDDRYIRFKSFKYGQGAVMALPIWESFMAKAYQNRNEPVYFKKPPMSEEIDLFCNQVHERDIF